MNKSTIVLLSLAAMVMGSLIGTGLARKDSGDEFSGSAPANALTNTGGAPVFRWITPSELAIPLDEFERPLPALTGENFLAGTGSWKTETVSFEIPLDAGVEYKVLMAQGDSMVFDWTANGHAVYSDFHGHDSAYGDEFFVRYEESQETRRAGMLMAGFSGGHGWYWLNLDDVPITITLRVAGFFQEIVELETDQ